MTFSKEFYNKELGRLHITAYLIRNKLDECKSEEERCKFIFTLGYIQARVREIERKHQKTSFKHLLYGSGYKYPRKDLKTCSGVKKEV